MPNNTALIVVDMQHDFIDGTLAVPGANDPAFLYAVNGAIESYPGPVFASADYHPPNHMSFKANGGTWPAHCVQGTPGADLVLPFTDHIEVIRKGTDPDKEEYSAATPELLALLNMAGVEDVTVIGLAYDYCVSATALGLRDAAFKVTVPLALTKAVDAGNVPQTSAALIDEGVTVR